MLIGSTLQDFMLKKLDFIDTSRTHVYEIDMPRVYVEENHFNRHNLQRLTIP
jgi:hypothetical protein